MCKKTSQKNLKRKMYNETNAYKICIYMEASEPKWVNPVLNIIKVNSLSLGGLHI